MVIGTFTRFCWLCSKNKSAFGGRLNKRKLWQCAACVEGEKMKWNKGDPPSVGWWPTKHYHNRDSATYRWWDGDVWSWAAFAHEPADKAAVWAAKKETLHLNVEWAERPANWPERSRT